MKKYTPGIAFLGMSENVSKTINGTPPLTSLSILDLRTAVFSKVYPLNINHFTCIFAIRNIVEFEKIDFRCRTLKENSEVFFANLSVKSATPPSREPQLSNFQFDDTTIHVDSTWTVVPFRVPEKAIVFKPDTLSFYAIIDDVEYNIGKVIFHFAQPHPLTTERIDAIKSDPTAAKFVKYNIMCNECNSGLTALAGIERPELKPNETWYQDLGEHFECSCKKLSFPLEYLRKGIVYGLGNTIDSKKAQTTIIKLYEKSTLRATLKKYKLMIDSNPLEEEAQIFFKDHPILFHIFSPFRIITKAPILSQYKTDFAILSKKGTLFLIEIEKPGKKIIKKGGGSTSDFNHPFDQVTDWLHVIKEHRVAVLSNMGIDPSDVTNIKGVVIIGRDKSSNRDGLRKLKSKDHGEIDFYTYDDIAGSFETLIREFDDL